MPWSKKESAGMLTHLRLPPIHEKNLIYRYLSVSYVWLGILIIPGVLGDVLVEVDIVLRHGEHIVVRTIREELLSDLLTFANVKLYDTTHNDLGLLIECEILIP